MEPIFRLALVRLRAQLTQFAIAQIDSMHFAFLAFRVKDVAIGRIKYDIKTVATGGADPIRVADAFLALHAAGTDPILIVLKSAGDAEVRFRIVQGDSIEFSRRNAVEMLPALSGRKTLIHTAIRSEQQTLANRRVWWLAFVLRLRWFRRRHGTWVNYQRMTIGMNFVGKIFPEILAAVIRNQKCVLEQINALIVCRTDSDLLEIERTRIDCAYPNPFFASVFGTEYAARFAAHIVDGSGAALITLHPRHDDARIACTHGEADATRLRR